MRSEAAPPARCGATCALCGAPQSALLFRKGGFDFVRCTACGLVSLHPLPTAAEQEAHHDASYRAGRYASFAAAEHVRAAIAARRLAAVRPLAPAGPWLDVGCSTGTFVAAAAAAGLDAEGLELSAPAVAEARARGRAVRQGAVEDVEPGRRYAAVTAFDLVEHLRDPAAFVRRVARWLVPGGVFAATVPDIGSPTARLLGRQWFYYAAPDHVHYFTRTTLRRLLEEGGLAAVTVRTFHKPLTLAYATEQASEMAPPLAPLLRLATTLLPRSARDRAWPLPLGEMLATARAPS